MDMMIERTISLPEGYRLRVPCRDDIPELIALMAACDRAQVGTADPYTEDDILDEWRGRTLETDAWVVVAPDGRIASYGLVMDVGHGQIHTDGYVHPEHQGRGLGTALVRLMEARARELIAAAPEGTRVVAGNGVHLGDAAARAILEREGYTLARCFWRMEITLDAPPAPPEWPAGITVRTMVPGQDERAVFEAVEEAFQDHWGHVPRSFEQWITRTTRADFDPSLWLLAMDGDQIAGATLSRVHPAGGWIGSVAVRRPWRRRGLARAMLRQAFGLFYARGVRTIGLGVDSESLTGATRLYEEAGMHVARQYVIYEKELRPGRDLSVRDLD
jgi:mycothiol synthase